MSIYKKVLEIQRGIQTMSKDGHNDFSRYDYLTETQVTTKVKELMDKHGVVFEYSSEEKRFHEYQTAKGGTQFLVGVEVEYAFVDADTGEKMTGRASGHGADTGDKGIYKAITGAIKYIHMKTFNIPTGNDTEKDSPAPRAKKEPNEVTVDVNTLNF